MRIRIKLKHVGTFEIPFNYNYQLSASIYDLLQFGSKEFSDFLHSIGFKTKNKVYKLFTFSLRFDDYEVTKKGFLLNTQEASLYISSPRVDDFFRNVIIGSFKKKQLTLVFDNYTKIAFNIRGIEELPQPHFNSSETKFIFLTPLVLSTMKEYNGKLSQYYFRYYDDIEEINRVLNENLTNKYEIINNKKYLGKGIKLKWDEKYLTARKEKDIIKKISLPIKKNKIEVIGNLLPFTLEGDKELMKVGYEAGFGEKNSMGFGMAKVVRN